MVVRNIVGTPFWDATASIRLTKNSRSFAWIAKIRSMLRRRCRVVMDEEYVQEHILTGGIVGPSLRRLADSFMAAYSHFAPRCRVITHTSSACFALRACVARASA